MTGAGPIGLFVKTRPELDSPDVQYQFLAGSAEKTGEPMHRFPGCTMVAIPCRPESRGWLRIKSPDPTEAPAMQPNYLSTQRGPRHHRRRAAGDAADLRHRQHAALLQGRDLSRARRRRPTRICWTMSAPPPARRSTRPAPA